MPHVFLILMALIVNSALAGFTVSYNGVQFGGADATYKSLPPMYEFSGKEHWDDSGRAVMWMDYTLNLKCVFFEDSEFEMAANMKAMRGLLLVPGKALVVSGLGSGFGTIATGGTYFDLNNGPRPGEPKCVPVGNLCWELTWSVSFSVSECVSPGTANLAFAAFNFETTWVNDFEGITTRTITGHVVIAQLRNSITSKTVLHVAEETRGSIVVSIPTYFERTTNAWHESMDKSRLEFTIIDELIDGDYLPPGVTAADGSFSFSAGDGSMAGSGMASAMTTMTASFKTAINQPRNLAGQIFMAAALSKQVELSAVSDDGSATVTVVPVRLSIANGKFGRARQTDCSMAWVMTKTLSDCLAAAGIWSPIGGTLSPNDYTLWRASIASLWGNRGFANIGSDASEAVIIDLCDNVTTKTIGVSAMSANSTTAGSLPSLTCPDIPENGGWLHFDMDVRIYREDQQTQHRKAASYLPTIGTIVGQDPGDSASVTQGGPSYTQSATEEHVTEYHGFPETLIGISFAGLRFKNKPFIPEIKTVGGMSARLWKQSPATPKIVFDAFGCPIWSVDGWRIYSVPGYVASVKAIGSKVSGAAPTVPEDL